MTNNRSVLLISAIGLILLALVPAVSALDVIYDEELFEYIDTTKSGEQTFTRSQWTRGDSYGFDVITFKDITKAQLLDFLVFEVPANCGHWLNLTKIEEGRYDFIYTFNDKDRPGV